MPILAESLWVGPETLKIDIAKVIQDCMEEADWETGDLRCV